jgi:hypothetical protein
LRALLQLAHEKQWFRDERFDLLPALAARRLRDRAVTEAIGQITQSPGIEQMALPEREPSEEDIQAEMKEIRFVERLWQTIPDLRNQLAHGSSILHPNSRYTLRVACQAINQLFPQTASHPIQEHS